MATVGHSTFTNAKLADDLLAPLIGVLGVAAAMVLTCLGAAYGTAKAMIGIAAMAPRRPGMIMKSVVPVVMAGVLAIYGLVVGVIIAQKLDKPGRYSLYSGFCHLSAGLAVGICGLASGWCIGVLGDFGSRASAMRPQLFMTSVLMTGFAMVLGMYGLIAALLQGTK